MNYPFLIISGLVLLALVLLYKSFTEPKREKIFSDMMEDIEATKKFEQQIKQQLMEETNDK